MKSHFITSVSIILVILIVDVLNTKISLADPLIYSNNLVYKGAFKVPAIEDLSYGGSVIAYNPINHSIIIVGRKKRVGEISIVEPIMSDNKNDLNRSILIQPFTDITEGNLRKIGPNGTDVFEGNDVSIGGLLVHNEKLIGSAYAFYSTEAVLSHFTSGLDFSVEGDFSGMYAVGSIPEVPTASFVSGYMTNMPQNLHSLLGGSVLTGNGSLSIISRTSYGPAAFSFDPSDMSLDEPTPAEALLYYTQAHQTLGTVDSTNPLWNGTTKMAGMSMISGSRSLLYFGYHGIGERNYGQFSDDPIYADECSLPDKCVKGPKGWPICADPNDCTTGRKGIPYDPLCNGSGSDGCYYDPTGMGAKGPHAYPYIYQVWAYNINDLIEVKNGLINPWDVLPYAVWQLPFKVEPTSVFGGASAYDPKNRTLFIVAPISETHGCCTKLPLIHVFDVNFLIEPDSAYRVGGKVMLLEGTVTLNNNNSEELIVSSDSRENTQDFWFSKKIAPGNTYNVTVAEDPAGLSCQVLHGSGKIDANADISNIIITCKKNYIELKLKPPSGLRIKTDQ